MFLIPVLGEKIEDKILALFTNTVIKEYPMSENNPPIHILGRYVGIVRTEKNRGFL